METANATELWVQFYSTTILPKRAKWLIYSQDTLSSVGRCMVFKYAVEYAYTSF
jgi:hypothetical protein